MGVYEQIILSTASLSFLIFLFLHFLIFRYIDRESLLKWIINLFMIAGAIDAAMLFLSFSKDFHLLIKWQHFIFFAILSLSIYSFLSFFYIVCIFGPYASSIRFRLIREFFKEYPRGLTKEEILERYNTNTILDGRLKRLTGSGDIVFDGKVFRLKRNFNFFLLLNGLTGSIRRVINK